MEPRRSPGEAHAPPRGAKRTKEKRGSYPRRWERSEKRNLAATEMPLDSSPRYEIGRASRRGRDAWCYPPPAARRKEKKKRGRFSPPRGGALRKKNPRGNRDAARQFSKI